MRRKPSAYALLLLFLTPFAALAYLLALLVGAVVGRGWDLAPVVLGGLALLGPFAVRVLWYRRHTRVEFRHYEKGLVAVTAGGREVLYPWQSTAVFTDGWDRFKLSTPEGTVVTLGPTDRRPALGGERIKGLRTRTVIRGAQVLQDDEWYPAILYGVQDAQLAPATATALDGGGAAFGDLVLSRDGLTVRRRHGRDDFTTWEDVRSLELSPEGLLMVSSRGNDFPTHFMRYRYRIPNLEIFLDLAHRLHRHALRPTPAPAPPATDAPRTPEPPTPEPSSPEPSAPETPTTPDTPGPDTPGPDTPGPDTPGPDTPGPDTPPPDARDPDAQAPARPAPAARDDELLDLLTQYLTYGIGLWAAWRLGTREEIDGLGAALLAVVRAVLGGIGGVLAGLLAVTAITVVSKVGGEILVESAIRWFRHRRYIAAAGLALCVFVGPAALLFLLFRAFPSRLVPLAALLFFGGWALLLAVARCVRSDRAVVRHLPDLFGVLLVALACQQLVSGDVLTVAPAAGLFFPLALWLSWRGWRWMKDSPRRTVQAAADVVLSVELGLVLTLLMVWLANVLSFTPPQVTVVLEVVEKVQGLTEVHWLYWMAAYAVLAIGSYLLLARPALVARVRRLRPARFGESRLPLGLTANFVQRSFSGINIGIMVALIFLVVVAPVSEGAWKRPVDERYALEVQRREYAEGAAAAYQEIHRQVVLHPRSAARIGDVIIAAHRIAPSPDGEPVNRTALDIARQAGRFQAGTLDVDTPAPEPATPPAPAPEGDGLDARLGRLDETQQQRAEREERTDRFAELASLAVTRTLDTLGLGDNQAVQLVKEYLGGLVEDGPVKTVFHRWGEGIGQPPPEGGRLVRIDVRRLTAVAYERTAAAVERSDAGLLTFYGRFGIGVPAEDSSLAPAVDLANQHRYLRQGTGPCTGCAAPMTGGSGTGGSGTTGGGGRR
ncbi:MULTISPECIES: hypothetical protein [Streptomyces]|uniref:hypothetical protein n=1 Tax=Streptomyces TaxID=1883 RepID=UPI00093BF95A|nr:MULTISPECIES: hypothetical protein [unclassified Streptomyces]OKJ09731.1 hypothetical protein AMK20_19730 [Streptomyces sp. TSRI0261]QNQ32441.1 hypothetical protein HYC88_01210 [Streptomyces sp. CB00271]